jgi:exodeoxyribonuclease-3
MRIASFNVNGINGRLSVLLEWLAETSPAIVWLLRGKPLNDWSAFSFDPE